MFGVTTYRILSEFLIKKAEVKIQTDLLSAQMTDAQRDGNGFVHALCSSSLNPHERQGTKGQPLSRPVNLNPTVHINPAFISHFLHFYFLLQKWQRNLSVQAVSKCSKIQLLDPQL